MNDAPDGSKVLPGDPPVLPREAVQRWRLVLARRAIAPESTQREQQGAWEAALVASGLPIAGLDAPKARPRHAHAAPLAAAIPGEAELMDLWLVERLPGWRVREALAANAPAGWQLVDLYDVWPGEAALPGRVAASVYRATLGQGMAELARLETAAGELLAADTLPRERRKGDAVIAYDLRPFLDDLAVAGAGDTVTVTMILRHDPERGVGRPEEALAALGERAGLDLVRVALVRERLVLGDPPPPPTPAPRRGLRPGAPRPAAARPAGPPTTRPPGARPPGARG